MGPAVPVQSRDEWSERNAEAVNMGLLQGAEDGRVLRSKQSATTAEGRSAVSLEASPSSWIGAESPRGIRQS